MSPYVHRRHLCSLQMRAHTTRAPDQQQTSLDSHLIEDEVRGGAVGRPGDLVGSRRHPVRIPTPCKDLRRGVGGGPPRGSVADAPGTPCPACTESSSAAPRSTCPHPHTHNTAHPWLYPLPFSHTLV